MREEIDAGAALVHEFDKYAPVKVAFWLKASDNEFRYLYIASDQIDGSTVNRAYQEIWRLTYQAPAYHLPDAEPLRVKLINGEDPLARAAVELHQRFPSPNATRFGGTRFGGVFVDDVYLYPLPQPVAVA